MSVHSQDQYATLIASLPSPDGLFKAKIPPLSRLKLEKRLLMLTPEHRHLLHLVESMLDWRLMSSSTNKAELISRYKKVFLAITNRTLRRLIQERLEIRTLILAMRIRQLGLSAPDEDNWGFGRWQRHIVRHWDQPAFNLQGVFNWAIRAENLLKQQQMFELEKLLLEESFRQLQRHSGNHQFDFEAVVIYVMKWNIVNRSTQYNSHVAGQRFETMMNSLLADKKEYVTVSNDRNNANV